MLTSLSDTNANLNKTATKLRGHKLSILLTNKIKLLLTKFPGNILFTVPIILIQKLAVIDYSSTPVTTKTAVSNWLMTGKFWAFTGYFKRIGDIILTKIDRKTFNLNIHFFIMFIIY